MKKSLFDYQGDVSRLVKSPIRLAHDALVNLNFNEVGSEEWNDAINTISAAMKNWGEIDKKYFTGSLDKLAPKMQQHPEELIQKQAGGPVLPPDPNHNL